MSELKASGVVWKRLRRVLLTTTLVVTAGGAAAYGFTGGRLLLDADGMVTREHVAVSAPYEARIRQVLVRPGDRVEKGQRIAVVESATLSRTLADLSIEKARIEARLAQLEGRRTIIKTLLPMATGNAEQTKGFLDDLRAARAKGLTVERTLQEASSMSIQSAERALTLEAEQVSVETEIAGNRTAMREVSATYARLQQVYNEGVLTSPVDGYVGGNVGAVGEVLTGSSATVAKVYSGTSFALAYLPESYLLEVEEGQKVGVKARGQVIPATIERVLPMTEALPPEFQLPNKARERGQLVRISLDGSQNPFALEQKVRITSCFIENCSDGISGAMRAAVPLMKSFVAYVADGVRTVRAALPSHDDGDVQDSARQEAPEPKNTALARS
jgi:multidrug resistance efflux pump